MWGFLGDVTWAVSRNNAVVHCYVSLATQQLKRRAYPQHCYASDNRHRDVSMVRGLLSREFYWFVVSRVWKLPSVDVFLCLATDYCWLEHWVSAGKLREKHVCLEASCLQKLEFVTGESRGRARTCVWRFTDCKNVSSCWEITRRGHVEGVSCGTSLSADARRVFGERLSVFNCSVLSFWKGNKLPSWTEHPVRYRTTRRILLNRLIQAHTSDFIVHYTILKVLYPYFILICKC
jgi:hypothetical protein